MLRYIILLIVCCIGFTACSLTSKNNPRIDDIDSLIQKEIEANNIPGAVIMVKKGRNILHKAAYGHAKKYDYELKPLEDPEAMTTNHLFDLASLTKVTATTFGIMLLLDKGQIQLDDPIRNYLPEFGEGEKANITIRHLLTHTSGLPQWEPIYYHASNHKERYEYIAGRPLKWKVGQERHYSDLGFMLLEEIIRKVTGITMAEFLDERLYEPLNLNHTTFNPKESNMKPIAATSHGNPFEKRMVYDDDFGYKVDVDPRSWNGWREYTLVGEVNDGNAWYASGGESGHAGLFSTVDDLQVLVDLLMQEGSNENEQLISSSVVDTFLTKDEHGNGLGWAMDPGIISAEGAPEGTYGHTGFTGTSIVIVPKDQISIIILTNRQHVGPQEDGSYYDLGPLRNAVLHTVIDNQD